ncbi:MAG: DeoR/GlpR family DNA-binding transcription regulator [Lentisphaerota bacterium]
MNQRQQELLDRMNRNGNILIESEAEYFCVAPMTIRRDLRFLEKNGLAVQTKKGAIPKPKIYAAPLNMAEDSAVKRKIAAKLLKMIEPSSTIMLSTGTTTLTFARLLAQRNLPLTIITNSIPIASALFQTRIKVILIGGELRTTSLDLVGPAAEKYLSEYHIDLLVTGCDGADAEQGFYTSDLNLANLEKLSAKVSDKVIVITESHKFGKKALVKFTEITDVDAIITDSRLKAIDRELITRHGVEAIVT